ncbi:hypothetical protein DPEC_G00194910 [Dallia pectoralis]|uniref:Uncharacterized protein n=1 Tax=Dallia pectoralis TaxID=75939 RepID=A0ACC2G763_DALPE|nr:hypothetical protein DPEC_G00194910 [Dallia pectoralis]
MSAKCLNGIIEKVRSLICVSVPYDDRSARGSTNDPKLSAGVLSVRSWLGQPDNSLGKFWLHICAQMSKQVDEGNRRPMNRLSTMFSSLQEKIHRDWSDRDSTQPCPPASAPARLPALDRSQRFFEYLVVVSLRKKGAGTYEPQITYQFPKRTDLRSSQREEEEKSLKAILLFCFPEGINWAPLTEYPSETFSFVLTEVDGSRRNGYCRRLLPSGRGARAPEAYCIISQVACFGLFSKIFDEVEKRRQISMAMIYPFMQSLREAPFPAPGNTVKIKSFIPESGTEIISLTRPLDSWLEHVDFRTLFRCLSDEEVLQVFASAVLERRIIFIAEELSTLSQVLHAVAALLYPFTWQHTFISIVPSVLIDVVMAPTPYLLGVQRSKLEDIIDQSDLLIVDLTEKADKTFITCIGDESSILPEKLQVELLQELCCRKENPTSEELNKVVSEAFLSFFVKTVGHLFSHVTRCSGGKPGVFQNKSFYKAIESKAIRQFVKLFIQTQMFDLFIQEVERQPTQEGAFHKRIMEDHESKKKEKAKKGWIKGLVVSELCWSITNCDYTTSYDAWQSTGFEFRINSDPQRLTMAEKRRSGGASSGTSDTNSMKTDTDNEFLSQGGVGDLLREALLKMVEARSEDPVGFLADHFCNLASVSENGTTGCCSSDGKTLNLGAGGFEQQHVNRALWHLRLAHHSQRSAFSNNVRLAYDLLTSEPQRRGGRLGPNGQASPCSPDMQGGAGVRGRLYTHTIQCLCSEGGVPISTSAPLLRRLHCQDHEAVPYDVFRHGVLTCAVFSDYIRRAQRLYAEVCGPAKGPASRTLCLAVLGTLREALETSRSDCVTADAKRYTNAKAYPYLEANTKASHYLEASAKISPGKLAQAMVGAEPARGNMDAKEFEDAAAELFISRVRLVC